MKKETVRRMDQILAGVLAAVMLLTCAPPGALAEGTDGTGEGGQNSAFTILLNGNNAARGNNLTVAYHTAVTLTLKGYTGTASPAFIWLPGSETPSAAADWHSWSEGAPTEPGTYYLGYGFEDSDGNSYNLADGSYAFTIAAGQLAAPSGLAWSNGTTASWTANTADVQGTALEAGVVSGYTVTLSKDGSPVGKPQVTTDSVYDFTDAILQQGKGVYTFTVQANTANSVHYGASAVSAASGPEVAAMAVAAAGEGITAVTPTTPKLLLAGNSAHNTIDLTASIRAGRVFGGWSAAAGVRFSDAGSPTATATLEAGYTGSVDLALTAGTSDTEAPAISSYKAGTGAEYGKLKGTAVDSGSAVSQYAFSTATEASGVGQSEWLPAPSNGAGISADVTYQVGAAGTYYFYVKDASGNVTRSANAIQASEVDYSGYYSDGTADASYKSFIVGDGALTLAAPSRPGFTSSGWHLKQDCSDAAVSTLSGHEKAVVTVYTEWTRQSISITAQPQDYSHVYDGASHTLSVTVGNTAGTIACQWYKTVDGSRQAIAGATGMQYSVKNVADSGSYSAEVTVTLEGKAESAFSSSAAVTITPAPLTLTADSHTITYGEAAPEYTYTPAGLAGGDTKAVLTPGKLTCAYAAGDAAGEYAIEISGFTCENYAITHVNGKLTVSPKGDAAGTAITASLSQTAYTYTGSKIQPAVTVKDGEKTLTLGTDYTVAYSDNTNVGTAKATVTLQGNYSGVKELTFTIADAAFTASVLLENWTYGETAGTPSVSANASGGAVTYYYYAAGQTAESATTVQPTAAGSYKVYAVIAAMPNYTEVRTAPAAFRIDKRVITLTAASGTWAYDGNTHSAATYTSTGTFAGKDNFQSVTVTGEITNVGTVKNAITYVLTSVTNPNNYEIQTVDGTLTVAERALTTPVGGAWDSTAPGTAAWVPLSRDNLTISYVVSLYRVKDGADTLIQTKSVTGNSVNFADAIRGDSTVSGVAGYRFTVQALPSGGASKENYGASEVSQKTGALYTASVTAAGGLGIESVSIGGKQSVILLAGEHAALTAAVQTGYAFSGEIWSQTGGAMTLADAKAASTTATLPGSLNQAETITLTASCGDELPAVTAFSAAANADSSQVAFTFSATDTKGITAWAVTTSETEQPTASQWNNLETPTTALTNQKLGGITAAGTYYVWVKDDGGNMVCSASQATGACSIEIYKIAFAAGDGGSGSMPALLKVENLAVKLPANAFEKSGYSFQNWKGDSGIYANEGSYAANVSDVLTAQWTDQQFGYTVNYYLMDTAGQYSDTPSSTAQYFGAYGAEISSGSTALTRTITGMQMDTQKSDQSITLTKDGLVLNIYYQRLQHTITYRYTLPGTTEAVKTVQKYYYGASVTELAKPAQAGYTFVGWVYSGSGAAPATMPNNDLTADGTFSAADASYAMHYYVQDLQADGSAAGTYTLVQSLEATIAAKQDDSVEKSTSDAVALTGYTPAYVTVSVGQAGGTTVPSGAASSAAGKVSAQSGSELNINFYYTRNAYQLTLNVYDSNLRTHALYTYQETHLYGAAIDADAFANHEKASWTAPEGTVLADYQDWSTGAVPTVMPAGDVSVARDYIKNTQAAYRLEVYYETVTPGTFAREAALTYYGYAGSTVTVGAAGSDSVNYTQFGGTLSDFAYYDFDAANAGNVLTAVVNADGSSTMKIYFVRKTFSSTITYYYNEGSKNVPFATVVKKGKWGTTYSYQPLALFDGTVPQSWENDGVYTAVDSSKTGFNFKSNEYRVNYDGFYWDNGNHWPSRRFLAAADLTTYAGDSGIFGKANNDYIHVFYTKVDPTIHYTLDVVYNPKNLAKAGDATNHNLMVSYNSKEYKVRVANKADVFNSTWQSSASAEEQAAYPATKLMGSYLYGDTETLRANFTAVTINGAAYYLNSAEPDYLYIIDAENQFYYGSRVSYNFLTDELNTGKLGYDSAETYLASYKTAHGDSAAAEAYDDKSGGAYIFNGGFSSILYANGTYTFTFDYYDTYTVSYTMNGNTHTDKNLVKGQNVTVGCSDTGAFPDKPGYSVVWYKDGSYTNRAVDFSITENTVFYGRYEKNTIFYRICNYYEEPGTGTYITDPSAQGLTSDAETQSVDFTDGSGAVVTKNITITRYYKNGVLVMVQREIPCLTFTEVAMDYNTYLLDQLIYDEANSSNVIKGYCEDTGISLASYYTRREYILTVNAGNTDVESEVNTPYRVGRSVTLEKPEKTGYTFAKWTWQKWDEKTGAWTGWTENAPVLDSDGRASLSMPECNVRATAVWTPADYTSSLVHYFQTAGKTFAAALYAQLSVLGHPDTDTVLLNGTSYKGSVYLDNGSVLGASIVLNDNRYFFSAVEKDGETYLADLSDLIAVAQPVTAKSDTVFTVSDKVLHVADGALPFAFAVSQTGKELQTLTGTGSFTYNPQTVTAFYYDRAGNYAVALTAASTETGAGTGIALSGSGTYCYGEKITVKASVTSGYTFVGWYLASDTTYQTRLSASAAYTFAVKESLNLVALSQPDAAAHPTVSVTGQTDYSYGYSEARTNAITAAVAFAAGTDSANKVVSYQWYEVAADNGRTAIANATASTYIFPSGKDCGTYRYQCDVVITRMDNGKSATVSSEVFTVTVSPAAMTVEAKGYDGVYDGADHGISVTVKKPVSGCTVYYSDTLLTAENYQTQGQTATPVRRDVCMNGTAVGSYTIYYYIHDESGKFTDTPGSAQITIHPIEVSLKASGSYHKAYDGGTAVSGSVVEEGTDKYNLSQGTSFTVVGLLDGEKGYYVADFDAAFDKKDVDSASTVTLTSVKIVSKKNGAVNYNYTFHSDYTVTLSGYITPHILNIQWDDVKTFLYDGTKKAPSLTLSGKADIPSAEQSIADNLVVQGGQINAGSYTAYAVIKSSSDYKLSNYAFSQESCGYVIQKRAVTVTPVVPAPNSTTYDKTTHTVLEFTIGGDGLATVDGTLQAYTAEADGGALHAGTTRITPRNLHVYQGVTDATDNYAVTYVGADYVILPKTVTVSGFTADSRNYDGTTAAAVHTAGLSFNGLIAGDSLSIPETAVTGAFDTPEAGQNKTVTVALEASDLAGDSASDYALDTANSTCTATADITNRSITVTGVSKTAVYGKTVDLGVTYSGFAAGQDQTILTGTVGYLLQDAKGGTQTYTAATPAGTYQILLDVSGLSAGNYSVAAAAVPATLTISPRPLTVTASAAPSVSKVYDGTASASVDGGDWSFAPAAEESGIVNGDTVNLTFTGAVYDSKNASDTRTVTVSGLSVDNSNYTLSNTSFTITSGCVIGKKALTAAVENKKTTYGLAAPEFTASFTGFAASEDKTVLGGTPVYTCTYNPAVAGSRGAGQYAVTLSGYTSDNYQITFVPGTLTVDKAVIKVTAKAETITYGVDPQITYTSTYGGFQYTDDENVISGRDSLKVTCGKTYTDTPGTYSGAITPVIDGLTADNYQFQAVNADLVIARHAIRISGVTVSGKTYDGTTAVAAAQINTSGVVYEGILAEDTAQEGVNVTGVYADKNAKTGVTVNLTVALNSYLAARYALAADSQKTIAADIAQRALTVTVAPKTISYGTARPAAYSVTYGGFAAGDTAASLSGTLTFATDYAADAASGMFSPAGQYSVTAGGYAADGNYQITYADGSLTVSPAKLATPVVTWGAAPGAVSWTAPAKIGAVEADGYTVKLLEENENVVVSEETVGADVLSRNFLETMRAHGAGKYVVQVTAIASQTGNTDKKNVADSDTGVSAAKYAAKVVVKFDGGSVSQAAANGITIQNGASYVMIAGESGAAITAHLKNTTGFQNASLQSDSTALTVAAASLDADKTTVRSTAEMLSTLSAASDITVTLKVNATPATLRLTITGNPGTAEFGYLPEAAPVLTAVVTPADSDNLAGSEYDYTYQWYLKEGASGTNTPMENGTASTVTFPTGKSTASNKYWVTCEVTATRKDNGASTTLTSKSQIADGSYFNVVISRAAFTAAVNMSGWTYGAVRSTPSVTGNPGGGAVSYEYNASSRDAQTGWTTVMPKDAGTYYVRAVIAQTLNYSAFQTQAVAFTIAKAKLAAPENLTMSASATAPYGKVSWLAVTGPRENGGTNADSHVAVSYRVKLYRAETDSANAADWSLVYTAPGTAATWLDLTGRFTQKGFYRFTVEALAASSNQADNCADSDESAGSTSFEIKSTMENETANYEKVYDGTPITLDAKNDLTGVSYQWLCNNKEVSGAVNETLDLTYVAQSGTYTCRLSTSDGTSYSSNHVVTITPLAVTVTSDTQEKVYDGTPLAGTMKSAAPLGTGDTVSCTLASLTGAGTAENTISGVTIQHNGVNVFTEGGSGNCYTLTKIPGTLRVTPKSLGSGAAYAAGVTVSQPEAVTYDGTAHTPAVTVTDGGIVVDGAGKVLEKNKDYTAAYKANLHAGTAEIAITGIGNYGGAITQTFQVSKRPLTLTAGSASKAFDGKALTNQTCSVAQGFSLADGDEIINVSCSGTITDFGSVDNEITAVTIQNGSTDVTGDYSLTTRKGTLKITAIPAQIVITAASAEKTYDGTPLKAAGFTYTGTLLDGDTLEAVTEGSQTDAGESANTVKSFRVLRGGTDVTADYTFGAGISGRLTVKAASMTAVGTGWQGTYDGMPHSITVTVPDGAAVAYRTAEQGGYTLTQSPAFTAAGTTVVFYQVTRDNYLPVTGSAQVSISPATLTASYAGETVSYGSVPNLVVTVTGFVNGETAETAADYQAPVLTAGQTALGSYQLTPSGGSAANYRFSAVPGTLHITQKPIAAIWMNTAAVYDGAAHSPSVSLPAGSLVDGDTVGVSVESRREAGSYTLSANLTGADAGNYLLTNPTGDFTIQRAPVTFTVTEGTSAYDGTEKTAAVAAAWSGGALNASDYTIAYQNTSGAVVTPKDAGSYDIYAAIDNSSFRHAGASDGSARKIGVLTIYKTEKPAVYTVRFEKGAGDSGTVSSLTAAQAGTVRVLPENGFVKTGYVFAGWSWKGKNYQPGERFTQPAENAEMTARWTAQTYEIGGVVNSGGAAVENAVVTLMQGSRQVTQPTTTDAAGKFSFAGVLPGIYNLVASCNGVVQTVKVEITAADVRDARITLPVGKTNSIVEVEAGTPDIVVGNLEQTFTKTDATVYTVSDQKAVADDGATVEIKLTAAENPNGSSLIEKAAAKDVKNAVIGIYLDLDLTKNVYANGSASAELTQTLYESNVLLETVIPLPADLQGKSSYYVYREHRTSETAAAAAAAIPENTPNADGEYFTVNAAGTALTIVAKKYSTYAIGYTEGSTAPIPGGSIAGLTGFTVRIAESTGGRGTADKTSARKDEVVTITLTPDSGYTVSGVTAADKDGNPVTLTEQGDGSYTFVMPESTVTVTPAFVKKVWTPETTGVSAVLETVNHIRYINGYKNGTVGPQRNMTRAEAAQMFYNLLLNKNRTGTQTFTDVPAGMWCFRAVNALTALGIVTGYENGSFGPNDFITREQFCAMAVRFTRVSGVTYSGSFSDVAAEKWSYRSVMTAAGIGWISGFPDGTFRPETRITRAETVTIVNHMLGRSADRAYVDANADQLAHFSDLTDNGAWYFYDMTEAANAHRYTAAASGQESWIPADAS